MCVSFQTTHWFVSCPATTTYLCWLYHSPLPNKKIYFVYLLTVAFLSATGWVFSLTISHDMHLVVPTHPSLFWVVCHPNRTFPPKEFEREPQNRFPLLPTARPYPLLPLTHYPPLLYWLDTSWWCLNLVRAPLSCMSKACLLLMHLPWFRGSSVHFVAHSWPLVAWTIFWSAILYGLLPSRAGPCLIVGFSLFSPLFAPFISLLVFLSCHPVILVVVLFDSCLLGLFWVCCMLFFHLIIVTQHCHWVCIHATWASLTHFIAYGLPRPISSSLGLLGHPRPIPILHFHGLLLILLGFPDPITISIILAIWA